MYNFYKVVFFYRSIDEYQGRYLVLCIFKNLAGRKIISKLHKKLNKTIAMTPQSSSC